MLFLALWALRNVAIAPLIGLPVVARAFARDRGAVRTGRAGTIVVGALALIVFLAVIIGVLASQRARLRVRDVPGEVDAVRGGQRAARHPSPHERLGCRLRDSRRTIPNRRVFLDDRYDMYPKKLIYDYFDLAEGKPGWNKILDRYRVETIVWDADSALAADLNASPQWQRVHRDKDRAVWVRS